MKGISDLQIPTPFSKIIRIQLFQEFNKRTDLADGKKKNEGA